MFGRAASAELRQLPLRGDVAWASACAGNLLGSSVLGIWLKWNGLGSGRGRM